MIWFALAAGLTVMDGDTFRTSMGERIRIENIDAPESGGKAKCDAERFLAVHARSGLKRLLEAGSIEITRNPRRPKDRYGRTLARVRVNGIDVGQALIEQSLAWPWEGRRHSWCAR